MIQSTFATKLKQRAKTGFTGRHYEAALSISPVQGQPVRSPERPG